MALLILGLILFIGGHLIPTFPALREGLVKRFGLNGYKGLVTLPSFAGLLLIIFGASAFRGTPEDIKLWTPPLWTRHLAFALMFVSFVLLAAANIPSKIRDAVKHPMVASITVWALAHLIANGDLLALLLFGSFLLYSIYDRVSVMARGVALRAPAKGWTGDVKALAGGGVAWAVTLFWLHGLAGAPLL
ncbi:putative membrane protein [Rhodoblastus acidophilus]|uniref:NnrU family protein n=1 Tax=Rhodoblastus acidophilus TaxID=1074 RepID=UPI002224E1E9|nr:NnrU family protein [Rhodoblastus acidophilus]MCW2314613.1 putative membrane protein [Rhodoblastus acidophilus]